MDHIALMRAVSVRVAAAQLHASQENYTTAAALFASIALVLDEADAKRTETEAKGTMKNETR